jgi:arylsulfatase A-like enzyme
MKRPNILILYTDQQRWDSLGVNGNADCLTPNLDRLAGEGVNFDHCFVQNPVCMPSRLSFLTGQYPSTLGVTHMGVPVPEDTITLPRLLRNYGYHSANIGKLHFLPHANRDHREIHPDYGFDHLEISDEPGPYEDAYRAWVRRTDPDQMDHLSLGLPPATKVWQETMGIDDGVNHPSEHDTLEPYAFKGRDDCTHTAFVADRTIAYLENRKDNPEPFLCIAGMYSPHAPWVAPQRYFDLYDREKLTLPEFPPDMDAQRGPGHFDDDQLRAARHGYYAMCSEVDHHVGRMLDALDACGLAEDTIVVFTSDHGEWLGEHLRWYKGYPAHDPVSRVPLIVRMPGSEQGRTVSSIVESVDVLPTLMDAAAIPVASHMQGRSLQGLLQGDDSPVRDSALLEETGVKVLRTEHFRYIAHDDGREYLYDLRSALGDYGNVAAEADYAGELARHRHLLLQRLIGQEQALPRTWPY